MNIMNTEPNLTVGAALTGVALAAFMVLNAAGIIVTKEMQDAVVALIIALMALPLIATAIGRFFVFPQASVDKIKSDTYVTGYDRGSADARKPTGPVASPAQPMGVNLRGDYSERGY